MSKFVLTVNMSNIASQIANLLNMGDQLWTHMTTSRILSDNIQYIIEMDSEKVIGVIGLQQYRSRVTELKHLCIHPEYRRKGLGKKLVKKGIEAVRTEFIYGTVRSDNYASIHNTLEAGLVPIGKKRARGYYIIIFARRKNAKYRIH